MKAIIWDLDGTLLDTPQAIIDIARAVVREEGLGEADPAAIRAGIGLPLPVALGLLLRAAVGAPIVARAVERYRELWVAQVSPRIAALVFPGVLDGLALLQRRGLRQAVATGKAQAGAESNVSAAGFKPFMEVVVGYDRVARPKPAPDMALLVLRELGLGPQDAMMVGDATHDLLMARDAGMRSIGVTYGAQEEAALRSAAPTFIAHSFAEVMGILVRLTDPAA